MQFITTKQIRQDLQGFLHKLQQGEKFTVMYRSHPVVSIGTLPPTKENSQPGSPEAIRHSLALASAIRKNIKKQCGSEKTVKQLYSEILDEEYGTA